MTRTLLILVSIKLKFCKFQENYGYSFRKDVIYADMIFLPIVIKDIAYSMDLLCFFSVEELKE